MLPNRNSTRLSHKSVNYRCVVSEVGAGDEGTVALAINVQSEENGAVLRVTGLTTERVPVMESRLYMGRQVAAPIRPQHVAVLIKRGIDAGWSPQHAGPPLVIQVTNEEVFGPATREL